MARKLHVDVRLATQVLLLQVAVVTLTLGIAGGMLAFFSHNRIAAEYDRRLVPSDLRPLGEELRARLARAIHGIQAVSEHADLLEATPVIRRSIDVRNPYVDPLNLVQVELLRRMRERPDARVHTALMITVNGIAAGMRNTG